MITVEGVEYKSFEDVQNITDPATRHDATMAWGRYEVEQKREKNKPKVDIEEKVKDERTEKIEKLGLDVTATDDQILAKEQEILDKENAEWDERATKVGLTEDATREEIEAKEKEMTDSTADENRTGKTDDDKDADSTAQETDTGNTDEQEQEKKLEERAKVFAQHNAIPLEQAKKIIESSMKIKNKYNSDADELAIAAYNAQATLDRMKDNIRKQNAMASNPYVWKEDHIILRSVDASGRMKEEKISKEDVVERFREQNPHDSEGLDDDAVFKMCKRDNENWFKTEQVKVLKNIENMASTTKQQFIESLPEADKEFLPDLEKALGNLTSEEIIAEGNTPLSVLKMLKGDSYDALKNNFEKKIKEAEKRGYDRGMKNAKIVGEEVRKPKANTPDSETITKKTGLSEAEKQAARARYGSFNISDEKMFDLYAEELKVRNKDKNKK